MGAAKGKRRYPHLPEVQLCILGCPQEAMKYRIQTNGRTFRVQYRFFGQWFTRTSLTETGHFSLKGAMGEIATLKRAEKPWHTVYAEEEE